MKQLPKAAVPALRPVPPETGSVDENSRKKKGNSKGEFHET
jgi:hypothetical protein